MGKHGLKHDLIWGTSVIIIDFNSAERTLKYIKDFKKFSRLEFPHYVIVDNSCNPKNLSILLSASFREEVTDLKGHLYCDKANQVAVYAAPVNEGFAKGNNIGFHIAKKLYNDPIVLFSNNDIIFDAKFDFPRLARVILDNDKIAAVGPKIVGLDGLNQSPYIYQSIYERWIIPDLLWPFNKVFFKTNTDIALPTRSGMVYRLLGAFIVLSAEAFEKIGGFDESTFLYAEELILSERLLKKNYQTYYSSDVMIVHEGGYTTKRAMRSQEQLKQRFKSEMYYFETYKNVPRPVTIFAQYALNFFLFKKKILDFIRKNYR